MFHLHIARCFEFLKNESAIQSTFNGFNELPLPDVYFQNLLASKKDGVFEDME